ncbi:MAG: PEP/pyruvate-binding domain-containing protein, partial [Bacteroidota bacterium]
LEPELVNAIRDSFASVFGDRLGNVPVFVRSDTNMEDLPNFTGAGLNLTLFNVVKPTDILQGIKRVWASPYTERSYKWRQHYLLNPENVFPSILIIPSVDVNNSGVMITKGVSSGDVDDITVAFSRGAGGAVEGQAAEAYLLGQDGTTTLLSPARERLHRRLPVSGGSTMVPSAFNQRILSPKNLRDLRELAEEVEKVMPSSPGIESTGPWDVELGFKDDKIWLFQIRPFVENKRAQSSDYLASISPEKLEGFYLDLHAALETSK